MRPLHPASDMGAKYFQVVTERSSMVHAMDTQLSQWPHLKGDEHMAERELLLTMADGIDAARESVISGSAALPLVNACRTPGSTPWALPVIAAGCWWTQRTAVS